LSGDRVAALRRMLEQRPDDARLRFGLALEYLNAGQTEEGVAELRAYLDQTDDEGNGWGRLGAALLELEQPDEARNAYRKGVEAANRHGHPTMADEFETVLDDLE
jgi:Flp pilus assembly protein TadD